VALTDVAGSLGELRSFYATPMQLLGLTILALLLLVVGLWIATIPLVWFLAAAVFFFT
jgi:hypothetical protein